MNKKKKTDYLQYLIDISDDDIVTAMKEIEGYIDITLSDFKELYLIACNHAAERIMHSVKAKNVMTKEVIHVKKDASLADIVDLMATHVISGVPVVGNEGEVIGIISEKDILSGLGGKKNESFMRIIRQCLENEGCIVIPISEKKAEDIMTSPAITVTEDTSVARIMNIFTEKNINRVPVLNQDMKLVGIVSRADALQTLFPGSKG